MDALRQYCAKKGIDVAQFESFRPWLVNTVIGVGEIQALGLSTEGVDTHFLKKAKAENKPIMELETAESQLQVLAGLTEELQGTMLAKLLAEVGKIREQFEKITAAWKAGDAKLMEEIMLQDPVKRVPEYEAVREKMFDERNEKMVEKLQAILKGGEPCMVIVGAGHLVGEKGIVKLLEKRKYRVEQVKRTAAKQTLKQHSQVLNALNALTM
jgi:uncharacterized protein YbaP (TraB family)